MNTSRNAFELIRILLLQLPSLLTIIGCILAAIIRWKRHPRVSLTLVIGLGLLFLTAIVFAFVYAFVPDLFAGPGNLKGQQTVASIISFFYHSSLAVGMGVVLAAILIQRNIPSAQVKTRRCPKCNRRYEDDELKFCLDDGSPLFSADDLEKPVTEVMSSRVTQG